MPSTNAQRGGPMIPETPAGWTLDVVRALVEQSVFETDRFDFKEMLPNKGDAAGKLRLAKACAGFANSSGGFLIFGVKDDKGLPAAERLVGVPSALDFPEHFGNYPRACKPSVSEWTFKNDPPIAIGGDRVIHVVHIATSPRRPHAVLEDERWWFCKRTNMGTESMSYEEVRGAFLDAGRRQTELAWLRAEVQRVRDLGDRLNRGALERRLDLDLLLGRFDVGQMKTLLLTVFSDVGKNATLVKNLHALTERCAKVDAVLAPMAAFAMQPRDRSYMGPPVDRLAFIEENAPQIVIVADHVLRDLAKLLA
jgi:hypothetical protein